MKKHTFETEDDTYVVSVRRTDFGFRVQRKSKQEATKGGSAAPKRFYCSSMAFVTGKVGEVRITFMGVKKPNLDKVANFTVGPVV